jgi:outer membrane immunogenic protein
MKKLLAVAVCLPGLLVMANGANAAGPAIDAAYDWSGAYIGLQAGYGWGNADEELDFNGDPADLYTTSNDSEGFFGGVHAGYNFQTESMLVLGIEVDVNRGDASDDGSAYFDNGVINNGIAGFAEFNWSGSARLRLGYAADRFMPYIAGGLAMADAEFGYDYVPPPGVVSGDTTLLGWTIGAGVEYAVTDSIRARLEYRYTDYGQEGETITPSDGAWDPPSPGRIDLQSSSIIAGISFAF